MSGMSLIFCPYFNTLYAAFTVSVRATVSREYLLDTAETHNIPYQYFVSKGGTDAGAAHTANEGIPSTVIGVCGCYIHTHQTMFSIADFDAAREMLIQVLKGLDESTIKTIIEGK